MKKLKKKNNRSARSIQAFCSNPCVEHPDCNKDPSGYARATSFSYSSSSGRK